MKLCGHRDDSKYYEMIDTGSFQILLNFRVESGDAILIARCDTSPRNAIYRSKSIQDDISCGDGVVNKTIISEINFPSTSPHSLMKSLSAQIKSKYLLCLALSDKIINSLTIYTYLRFWLKAYLIPSVEIAVIANRWL